MATYTATNLPVKPLEVGDKVVFNIPGETLEYTVVKDENVYWMNISGESNDYVFSRLGLDAKGYCKKAYGYTPPRAGNWPCANDLGALTRCVYALWGHIATMDTKPAKKRPAKGDWVKVVEPNDYFPVGTIGKIIQDDKDAMPFRVDNGEDVFYIRECLVEITEAPKFKPGMRVKITEDSPWYSKGDYATIERKSGGGWWCDFTRQGNAKVNDDGKWAVPESVMLPTSNPRPEFFVTLKANKGADSDAVVTLEQDGDEVNIVIAHNGVRSVVGWFRVHDEKINFKVDMCPNRWLEHLCLDDDGGMKVFRRES